ncbi:MAG: catalase [Polyangiales bacterium]
MGGKADVAAGQQSADARKRGTGGEWHETSNDVEHSLTTNTGLVIGDDQNSAKAGERGPTLLEDFALREKITHFDHERIPERVVHARGYGAHGYFQPTASHAQLTKADFLQDPNQKTPVFVRFSTVAGSEGSHDTARDVRGFAIKFYTREGNYDLVGNNIPVFFIQDALKFPDLIHAAKPEPDRGFPQAATAHDTFWDFVSLTPESTHMLMWAMSDRAIPRSFRMMEGFGVHTFRFINAKGDQNFVKFHLRPKLGSFSLVWDEAVKIGGADPDFHRRDLWEAIEAGNFPEWELSVQVFDQKQADSFGFDVLDATKLIPEELVPLRPLGKLVLDRNVDQFFAETEQVAFCPSHIVPGIDFSDDPLLQGRLFSYLDTQLSRLGSPNFQQIPINAPKCPWHNLQRDGHMQTRVDKGRVNYEPASIAPTLRENPDRGYHTAPSPVSGEKVRVRAKSFADHYTQARLFWASQTEPEQRHIVSAFSFELAKVLTPAVRKRVLGHLEQVDAQLGKRVAQKLGMLGQADKIEPAVPPSDVKPSASLSLVRKAPKSIQGRKVGVLVTDGFDGQLLSAIRTRIETAGAKLEIVAPTVSGIKNSQGEAIDADHALTGAPSVLFDALIVLPSQAGAKVLAKTAAAIDWVRDGFAHLKVIGYTPAAATLLTAAGVPERADVGLVPVESAASLDGFVAASEQHRIWGREPSVQGEE